MFRGSAARVADENFEGAVDVEFHGAATESDEGELSAEEIQSLILNHRENGRKLARSFLRRWRARLSLEEVDSIVDLTLCEAAKRYRPQRGASFMTFVFYHLRGYLVRAVANAANSNNIFFQLARQNGVEVEEIRDSSEAAFRAFVPDCASFGLRETECPETLLMRKEQAEVCRQACAELDDLEKEVLTRSFADDQPLVDIARSLGYSRCHISRVKKKALERLEGVILKSTDQRKISDDLSRAPSERLATRVAVSLRSVSLSKRGSITAKQRRARRRVRKQLLPIDYASRAECA